MPQSLPAPSVTDASDAPEAIEATFFSERGRLVALCARITSNPYAAEDLAQETLIVAWRHWHGLRHRERVSAWLTGIARNVCRRWIRAQGYLTSHQIELIDELREVDDDHPVSARATSIQEVDLEMELERQELVELLDCALALLPDEARAVLVERYVQESPINEIAGRLGISAPAAAMRLQRGKLALRQILTTTMREEIAPYLNLPGARDAAWQETRIWCFVCAQHHLRGRLTDDAMLVLTCPNCFPDQEHALFSTCPEIWGKVQGYGRALTRTLDWMYRYYGPTLDSRTLTCYVCGTSLPSGALGALRMSTWGGRQVHEFRHCCPSCHAESSQPLAGLLLASPEGRGFRQAHPRMRVLPEQEITVDGHPAILTRFVSLSGRANLEMVSTRDAERVVRIIYAS